MNNDLTLKFRLKSKKIKNGKLHTFFELIKNDENKNSFEIYLNNIFHFNDGSYKELKVREKYYSYKNEPHKILEKSLKNDFKNYFLTKEILFENNLFLIEIFTIYENEKYYKYQISILNKNTNEIFYLEQNGMFIFTSF